MGMRYVYTAMEKGRRQGRRKDQQTQSNVYPCGTGRTQPDENETEIKDHLYTIVQVPNGIGRKSSYGVTRDAKRCETKGDKMRMGCNVMLKKR